MNNYEDVLKYLNLALKNCRNTNETEGLRNLIKQLIINFEKLIKKHKKISSSKLDEKLYFPNPQLSLKLIDTWIKEQKDAINDN